MSGQGVSTPINNAMIKKEFQSGAIQCINKVIEMDRVLDKVLSHREVVKSF